MVNMKGATVPDYVGLRHQIMQLNAKKEEQEELIKHQVKELYYSIHPATILQNAITEVSENTKMHNNIAKVGLTAVTDYIIGKIFRRNSSIRGYFSSIAVEKITEFVLSKHPNLISKGWHKIRGLFKRKNT